MVDEVLNANNIPTAPTNPVGAGEQNMSSTELLQGQEDAQVADEELMAEIDRLIGETPPETQEALKVILETPEVNENFVTVMDGLMGTPIAAYFSEILGTLGAPTNLGDAEGDMSSRVAPEAPVPTEKPVVPSTSGGASAPTIPINKPQV
jgi:hypothetical protein